jgi:hypothetical protein
MSAAQRPPVTTAGNAFSGRRSGRPRWLQENFALLDDLVTAFAVTVRPPDTSTVTAMQTVTVEPTREPFNNPRHLGQ